MPARLRLTGGPRASGLGPPRILDVLQKASGPEALWHPCPQARGPRPEAGGPRPASARRQRAPKIAVPTRTCVAPHAIATSKSPHIPIDSTGSGAPSCARGDRGARGARRSTAGSPRDLPTAAASSSARRAGRSRRPRSRARASSASPRRDAALGRLAREVDREQHRLHAPPARFASSSASSTLSTAWTSATCPATSFALLRCSRPMKCQRTSAAELARAWRRAPARSSRRSRSRPRRPRRAPPSAGWVLETATIVTSGGIAARARARGVDPGAHLRPALGDRRLTPGSRARTAAPARRPRAAPRAPRRAAARSRS